MAKLVEAVKCAEVISEKFNIPLADLVDVFAKIPAADIVEVKHGEWKEIITHNGCTPDYDCVCSLCGESGLPYENYCPNCGAKTDGTPKERGGEK